ncbi:sigma-E processing peptidase SpoIIGA [Bacillus spongiae]|uniref:Sporulation sigma-E factor-processing peptidase n=1 Tax=Bacillus spongiae TaxID=2683610 RepID=A0ABU8HAB4_9BACI
MVIYLDVIWLLNVLFDTVLLWMTSFFLKREASWWKLLLGGFVGSTIIISYITPFAAYFNHPFSKLLFSALMVYVSFGFKRFRYFVNNLLMLYFVTFATGGFLLGTHFFIQWDERVYMSVLKGSVQGFGDPISWIFVMFGLPLAWYFSKGRVNDLELAQIQYDQLVNVTVNINQLCIKVKGIIDSGNQLVDPISKKPVMIVSIHQIRQQFPEPLLHAIESSDGFMNDDIDLGHEWTDRIRFIPARSIGKKNQLLVAFKPDSIVIEKGDENWKGSKGLISFTKDPLSADEAFACIVHPQMVSGPTVRSAS